MKKLLALMFLFCAASVFGAAPPIYAYRTNLFWTNNAGVLQPVLTNAMSIGRNGGLFLGKSTLADYGGNPSVLGLFTESFAASGDPASATVYLQRADSTDYNWSSSLDLSVSGSSNATVSAITGLTQDGWGFNLRADDTGDLWLTLSDSGGIVTSLKPAIADGLTAYTLGTSIAHTSGNLFELGNTTNTPLAVSFNGSLTANSSNVADIGSSLFPYRTNYAKAFTVVGSQRTVAYSDNGTIVGDFDAVRIRGATPLTTNYVIPAVATLIISNGLIFGITGP